MTNSLFTTLLLLVMSGLAYGQQGAVSGTVLDEDGFPMLGANVLIQGTTIGAQTDFIEGKYQFKADPGTYTIVASYVGFGDKIIEGVVVNAKETTILDIAFTGEEGGVNLDELNVEVVGTRLERGEVAVLKLRQNSDKVQDVISSQEISRIGAGTAAAALTKVTGTTVVDGKYVYVRGLGDRYSATTLNGLRLPSVDPYRNAAQLDLIPTNLLDNIVASKTFTPDLPGDFTGGSVNIKLKALPERFTWGVSLSTAYNPQNNFQSDFQTFDAGERAWLGYNDGTLDRPEILSDPRLEELGVLSRSAARVARRDNDVAGLVEQVGTDLGNGFLRSTDASPMDYSISANIGNQFQVGTMPVGVFASLGYSRDYSYNTGIRGNYVNPGGDGGLLQRTFELDSESSQQSPTLNGMFGMTFKPSPSNTISAYAIYSHQAFQEVFDVQGAYDDFNASGTENDFFRSTTSSFMEREMRNYVAEGAHTFQKLGNTKIDWAANYVSSQQLEPDLRFFAYAQQEGAGAQINASQFTEPSRFYRDLNDDSYQGKVDITIPVLQSKSRGNAIKFGGLYNTKERDFNEFSYQYVNRDGLSLEESGVDPAVYFGADNVGIIGESGTRNEVGLYVTNSTRLINSYTGESSVGAGYVMGTFEVFKRLKVIAGVRGEMTQIDVVSDAALGENGDPSLRANIDTAAFLPALNLVYRFGKEDGITSNLRASFTQTLARPNMREVAPFGSFGFIGEPPVFGNPDLELTSVNNYDLRYEIFPSAGDVIAASVFYKKFTNPIVNTFRPAGGLQYTWVNASEADLVGLEVELRKNLGFVTSSLADFTFSGNFTFIESNQDIDEEELIISRDVDPEFSGERPFAGQSNFISNINLSYDNQEAGWDAYLAYNFFSDRLSAIGGAGTPDIYENGRATLDLSIGKKIGNFKLSLRGRNLLDPNFRLSSEFRGQEYIYSDYRRGREVSLGVSYSL